MVRTTETFDITELVGYFRDALVALVPIMDRSRINWREGQSYDPWENIERTLFESIIGSCIENAATDADFLPLAKYGLVLPTYADRTFLVATDVTNAAFLELGTRLQPFDEVVFVGLDANLAPSDDRVRRPIEEVRFLLATPKDGSRLEFRQRIDYVT